jgi:hypothetical protein
MKNTIIALVSLAILGCAAEGPASRGADRSPVPFPANGAVNVSPVEEAPAFDRSNVRFWEFNTMDMDGKPVDMSRRHEIVRHLRLPADARIVADYRNPAFVLEGWIPVVQPSR